MDHARRIVGHSSATATAIALAALAVLAGCGGGGSSEAPARRPADFHATFEHVDGTTPPPFHIEWSLDVKPDGQAELVYVPGYSSPDVPRYRERLIVDPAALDKLYAKLRDAGLVGGDLDAGDGADAPAGGASDSAVLRYGGRTIEIPAYTSNGSPPLSPVTEDIKALVPAETWAEMERRHDEYVEEQGLAEEP